MKSMWAVQILLALIGLSAGIAVAGGLFAFIVELGVVADFADRTHTGDKILFYESCAAAGGIVGNIFYVFPVFLRRTKVVRYLTVLIISLALGKGLGACLFFFKGW